MDNNYIVVLFKNKVKRKIINTFITQKRAENFYKNLISESEKVIFKKEYENGLKCEFELALLDRNKNDEVKYYKDELGRQIRLELEDNEFNINKIQKYNVEETLVDYSTKQKITTQQLMKKYLSGDGIKMISKLNNKIVVQKDDDFNLFTLKNVYDSERFIDCLSENFLSSKRGDCIFVKDVSTIQRKYLYDILVSKGFPKKYLFKLSTTHLK